MKFKVAKNLSQKTKSGFSLIELLVSIAGASIISLAVATLLTNLKRQEKSVMGKSEQRGEVQAIEKILSSKQACTFSLGGLNPVTGQQLPAAGIRTDTNAATRYAVGQVDPSNLFRYMELSVGDYQQDPEVPAPLQRGRGKLYIRMIKANDAAGAREMLESIDINYVLTGNTVTECTAAGTTPDTLWRFSPVNPARIYYTSFVGTTHVGIGEDYPTANLDVSGTIYARFGASPANGFQFTDDPGTGSGDFGSLYYIVNGGERTSLILQNTNDPRGVDTDDIRIRAPGGTVFESDATYTEKMRIDSNGNVGIGTAGGFPGELLNVGDPLNYTLSTNKTMIVADTSNNAQLIVGRDDSNLLSAIWDAGSNVTEFVTSNAGTIYDFSLVLKDGLVGLGTLTPAAKLDVEGDVFVNNGWVEGQHYDWTSDENLKNIIAKAPGLDAIEKLNGYEYAWKANGKKTDGVMAQEVEAVLPDLVREAHDHKSVNYFGLIAPLIESIKELEAEEEQLVQRLEYLEQEIAKAN